jgi:hypothetical protein
MMTKKSIFISTNFVVFMSNFKGLISKQLCGNVADIIVLVCVVLSASFYQYLVLFCSRLFTHS